MLLVADAQQQVAASRPMLRAGQRRRQISRNAPVLALTRDIANVLYFEHEVGDQISR